MTSAVTFKRVPAGEYVRDDTLYPIKYPFVSLEKDSHTKLDEFVCLNSGCQYVAVCALLSLTILDDLLNLSHVSAIATCKMHAPYLFW